MCICGSLKTRAERLGIFYKTADRISEAYFTKELQMENHENEENNNENNQQPPQDPSGEIKQKLLFFVVAIILLVGIKFGMGL